MHPAVIAGYHKKYMNEYMRRRRVMLPQNAGYELGAGSCRQDKSELYLSLRQLQRPGSLRWAG
jgi:hypothetical protein